MMGVGSTRWPRQHEGMDVLSSRILLRSSDPDRSRRFYGDVLELATYREFGPPENPGVVFFLGNGLLEISGQADQDPRANGTPRADETRQADAPRDAPGTVLWLQVRDIHAEHQRLTARGVQVTREPREEPWGLMEMWIEDPDGVRIVVVEVPAHHPLRRDQR